MNCIGEAIAAKGLRGLAEWVPGVGPYLYDIAAAALVRLKAQRNQEQIRNDIRQAAEASFEQARKEAAKIAANLAPEATPEDKINLELYLSQIPSAVRRSLRRTDDPSGRTVPATLTLNATADLEKMLPQQTLRLRPGTELPGRSGWTLVEPLGVGGFGEVWLARHRDGILLDRAVKFSIDPTAKELLKRDAKMVARVMKEGHHPNIVPLLDIDLAGAMPWLAYEYVSGGELTALILQWQKLPMAERVKQAEAALKTLAKTSGHFHALTPPLVHRDLKPANILIMTTKAKTARLVITDFGIAGIAAQKAASPSREGLTGYTKAMAMLNGAYTPLYASPQQQRAEPPDPRDDVHALGVIAYQMLTGRLNTAPGPKFERELKTAGVPDRLIELIGDCVDPDQKHRPADGAAVAAQLEAVDVIEVGDEENGKDEGRRNEKHARRDDWKRDGKNDRKNDDHDDQPDADGQAAAIASWILFWLQAVVAGGTALFALYSLLMGDGPPPLGMLFFLVLAYTTITNLAYAWGPSPNRRQQPGRRLKAALFSGAIFLLLAIVARDVRSVSAVNSACGVACVLELVVTSWFVFRRPNRQKDDRDRPRRSRSHSRHDDEDDDRPRRRPPLSLDDDDDDRPRKRN